MGDLRLLLIVERRVWDFVLVEVISFDRTLGVREGGLHSESI